MKCANCLSDAIYVLDDARVSTVYYCGRCLPAHLHTLAAKGLLTIPAPVVEPVVEEVVEPVATTTKKKKTTATPVVEEPSVESTEEAPVEE